MPRPTQPRRPIPPRSPSHPRPPRPRRPRRRARGTARASRPSSPSTGWSLDSKPSTSSAREPSPANVRRASCGSIRRQFAGFKPDWEIARTHSAPRAKLAKRTPAEARWAGRGWTRIHASTITPSVPSEPASIRSGLTPAPEPGSRRDSQTPAGVSARIDSTKSSMCVQTVAKCPAARVAIQPPSVASSKDCGKWRSVSPCSPSWRSSWGPVAPAWMRAARETASTSSTRSERRHVDADRPVVGGIHARLHPADDARPAAVGDRGDALGRAPLQQLLQLALRARPGHEVRGVREVSAKAAHDVGIGLPVRVRGARVGVRGADRAQRGGRLDPRRRQRERLQRHGILDLDLAQSAGARRATPPSPAPPPGTGCSSS